jgi:hypothetical protein
MLKLQEKKRCMVQVSERHLLACVRIMRARPCALTTFVVCVCRPNREQGAFGKRSIAELQAMRISELKLLFDDGPL